MGTAGGGGNESCAAAGGGDDEVCGDVWGAAGNDDRVATPAGATEMRGGGGEEGVISLATGTDARCEGDDAGRDARTDAGTSGTGSSSSWNSAPADGPSVRFGGGATEPKGPSVLRAAATTPDGPSVLNTGACGRVPGPAGGGSDDAGGLIVMIRIG
jgi:hypothetical protein